jgi:hypothetical protein
MHQTLRLAWFFGGAGDPEGVFLDDVHDFCDSIAARPGHALHSIHPFVSNTGGSRSYSYAVEYWAPLES